MIAAYAAKPSFLDGALTVLTAVEPETATRYVLNFPMGNFPFAALANSVLVTVKRRFSRTSGVKEQ